MPVGKRINSRAIDLDHAQTIIEFTERGYHVWAKSESTPMWSLTFYEAGAGQLFSNQDPPARDGDRNIFIRPYYGSEDGRLHDNQPDWTFELIKLVKSVAGPNIHIH